MPTIPQILGFCWEIVLPLIIIALLIGLALWGMTLLWRLVVPKIPQTVGLVALVLGSFAISAFGILTGGWDVFILVLTAVDPTTSLKNLTTPWFVNHDDRMWNIMFVMVRVTGGDWAMVASRVLAPVADKTAFRAAFASLMGVETQWALNAWTTAELVSGGLATAILIVTGFYVYFTLPTMAGVVAVCLLVAMCLATTFATSWEAIMSKFFRRNHEHGNSALERLLIAFSRPGMWIFSGGVIVSVMLMIGFGLAIRPLKERSENITTTAPVAAKQLASMTRRDTGSVPAKRSEPSCRDQEVELKEIARDWNEGAYAHRPRNDSRTDSMCKHSKREDVQRLCNKVAACE